MMTDYILAAVIAYLIGSIPSGLILGKLFWHTDLREHGSHNIGATNAWRTLGKGAGIAVFIADSLKGQAGVALGLVLAGTPLAAVLGGLFAIIGHSFSIFLGFHGGKGVATSLGGRGFSYSDSCGALRLSDGICAVYRDCCDSCHRSTS